MKEIKLNSRGEYGKAKDKALTPTNREEIYLTITGKDRVIFILASYAGMRVGEIAQIRKEWFEISKIGENEVLAINIPNECRDIKNKYSIWRPKTRNARTTYILDKSKWLEVTAFFNYNESIGLSIRGLQEKVYKICGVSIHKLRATAQNYMNYELQLPTNVIASMLGHKDIRTTMQHYNTLGKAQVESFLINYKEK